MPRKMPTKKIAMKACKNCGALVPKEANICPVCGSNNFTEDWEGIFVVISTDSEIAKELKFNKKGTYAIKVSGSYIIK
ncbi:DNA-directed RNA polymerase, subunit E'' [Caldisphaera lagunensis DSM 15908]|uniref:Transcription elongation factor Spt4 n=1 Tax=Caldisphaera lagunensis (strain DSM 15908 / JCM 11604 / ANMR 0165 / IC-154) TaxID=1056495 RepID=L0A9U4_CALLD|nr:transcription elongation factor subunit Spt4 [Caldisphaera lagunensis]AFZ70189.1 DNA-directed RNA polymerase, subunit E'' [Caldisphaera lagunensis DSM 15908]